MADQIPVCKFCGKGRHKAEQCQRVSAIDYGTYTEGTKVHIYRKRVEFHPPNAEPSIFERVFGKP